MVIIRRTSPGHGDCQGVSEEDATVVKGRELRDFMTKQLHVQARAGGRAS